MAPKFSLAHLTVLGCPPAEATYIAADAGYDFVGFRTIPLGLPGEPRYVLAEDREMLRQTKAAMAETGVKLLDIEVARIADNTDVMAYLPALENAAELGGKHVVVNGASPRHEWVVECFSRLCDMAAPLGLTMDFEFITFSAVRTLQDAYSIVKESGRPNGGILVDTLHFDRSHVSLKDIDNTPQRLFRYAQVCDAPKDYSPTNEELTRTAREARMYLGSGGIPVKEILAHLPPIPYSIEIANLKAQQELGYREFARRCLQTARAYLGGET